MPPVSSGHHVQGDGWFLIMTKAQIAERRNSIPKYILELSAEWECGCMERIITAYAKSNNATLEEMYVRIIKFLMIEIDGQAEEAAERN